MKKYWVNVEIKKTYEVAVNANSITEAMEAAAMEMEKHTNYIDYEPNVISYMCQDGEVKATNCEEAAEEE